MSSNPNEKLLENIGVAKTLVLDPQDLKESVSVLENPEFDREAKLGAVITAMRTMKISWPR